MRDHVPGVQNSTRAGVHGVLLVRKKSGITSHDVVHSLRKIIGQKEIGHGGTLDPIAEGLMLILLGQGTKLSNYLLVNNKRYFFSFCLGAETDTLDRTGKILSQKPVNVSLQTIKYVLKQNQGKCMLPVPLFSAVKIRGKKLYEYVRANRQVEPPVREMFFYDLEIKNIISNQVTVELSCRKGSYIRSWVALIGQQLKTGAYLDSLVRLRSEPFSLSSALDVCEIQDRLATPQSVSEDGKTINWQKRLAPAFIPFSESLPHIQPVVISMQAEQQMKQGRIPIYLLVSLKADQKEVNQQRVEKIVRVMSHSTGQMAALLKLKVFKPPEILRVFSSLP